MRVPAMVLVVSAWLSALCACGKGGRAYHPVPPDARYEVRIWIEDDERMPREMILRGCAQWGVVHVACIEVAAADDADIRVYADDGPCVKEKPDGEGNVLKLAVAHSGGTIKMMMKCLRKDANGTLRERQTVSVAAHEVGHELGVDHVPLECTETARRHPSGRKICGPAVMNPSYDDAVNKITEIDILAFDFRNLDDSVLSAADTRETRVTREYWVQSRP